MVDANLAGDLKGQAESIVEAIRETGVKRLIFISSMGIYDEVLGERRRSVLDPYRDSAAVKERLTEVYRELGACLGEGRLFDP